MRQSQLILSNAAITWATRIFLLIPQLILAPFLLGTIGEDGYGLYALIWSLLLAIDNLEMSLQQGAVKYSAAFLAQGRMDELNKVVSSCFVYSILLAAISCAGTLVAAAFYSDPSGQMNTALVVVGILVLFIIPLTPYIAVIQSRQLYYVGAITQTISSYVTLLAVVVWFRVAKPSTEALIGIMAMTLFLSRLAQVPIAYRLVPGLRNRFRLFDWVSFRRLFVFGGAMVLVSLSLSLNSAGVRWLMGTLVSTGFVAHLAIMLMPGSLLSQIIRAMTLTIMPATSAYEATGNRYMLQELLVRSMRYTTILVSAGTIMAGLLMREILGIWVGAKFEFLAPYTFALFAGVSFHLSTSSAHHMLKGMGKLRTVVIIYLAGLVIVPLILILAVFQIRHDPYIAVTLGLSVGNLVCGFLNLGFGLNVVQAKPLESFKRIYVEPVLVAAAAYLLAYGIFAISGIRGLLGRTAVTGFIVLLFFGGCYFFIATAAERKQAKEYYHLVLDRMPAFWRKRARP